MKGVTGGWRLPRDVHRERRRRTAWHRDGGTLVSYRLPGLGKIHNSMEVILGRSWCSDSQSRSARPVGHPRLKQLREPQGRSCGGAMALPTEPRGHLKRREGSCEAQHIEQAEGDFRTVATDARQVLRVAFCESIPMRTATAADVSFDKARKTAEWVRHPRSKCIADTPISERRLRTGITTDSLWLALRAESAHVRAAAGSRGSCTTVSLAAARWSVGARGRH